MKKMLKKGIGLVLSFALVFSLCIQNTSAANETFAHIDIGSLVTFTIKGMDGEDYYVKYLLETGAYEVYKGTTATGTPYYTGAGERNVTSITITQTRSGGTPKTISTSGSWRNGGQGGSNREFNITSNTQNPLYKDATYNFSYTLKVKLGANEEEQSFKIEVSGKWTDTINTCPGSGNSEGFDLNLTDILEDYKESEKYGEIIIEKGFSGVEESALSGLYFEIIDDSTENVVSTSYFSSDFSVANNNGKLTIQGIEVGKTYTIREVNYDVVGYTRSSTVAIDGGSASTGTETSGVTVTANGTTTVTFINDYVLPIQIEATPVDVSFGVMKDLNGGELVGGDFKFIGTLMPDLSEETIDVTKIAGLDPGSLVSGLNNAYGEVLFSGISISEVGDYWFKLTEVNDGANNIEYDPSEYYVKVVIGLNDEEDAYVVDSIKYYSSSDAGVNFTEEDKIEFVNSVKAPTSAKVTLTAEKNLNNGEIEDYEFNFNAKLISDGTTDSSIASRSSENNQNGSIAFQELTFTKEGIYIYEISETKGLALNVEYDQSVYYAEVVVKLDPTTNKLEATTTYYTSYEDNILSNVVTEGITFVNTIEDPTVASLSLTGIKTLDGVDPVNETFDFILEQVDGDEVVIPNNGLATNVGGTIDFGTLEFTKVGIYTFEVTETNGGLNSITYDETVYTVTVIVSVKEGTNVLEANMTILDSEEIQKTAIRFENTTIDPTVVSLTLEATKRLESVNERTLIDNEFVFTATLISENGEFVDGLTNDAVSAFNKADGSITFEGLSFKKADTYTFEVSEEIGGKNDIEYDESVYYIQVEVTVNTDTNELEANATYYNAEETILEAITFVNKEITISQEVEKVWEDDDNAYEDRAESIVVSLYANEELYESIELSEENDWKYVWTTLAMNDEDGNPIVYEVKEITEVEGYETTYRVEEGKTTIINTHGWVMGDIVEEDPKVEIEERGWVMGDSVVLGDEATYIIYVLLGMISLLGLAVMYRAKKKDKLLEE